MRYFIIIALFITACNQQETTDKETTKTDTSLIREPPETRPPDSITAPRVYANKVFRVVTVEKTGPNTFFVKGQARIFEAVYNWVVEDGHNQLKEGYGMTDAGAPEWGNFSFTLEVSKQNPNSVPHLILFEVSAKDGSRKDELPVPLPY